MEAYKNSCDHCGRLVNKKYWTFNLDQCVVCNDPLCKSKQKEILDKTMASIVDTMTSKMFNNHKDKTDD